MIEDENDFFRFVIKILNDNNIKYFIDQGSLLGIIRENRILPWEDDLDFGLFSESYDKNQIIDIFVKNGFTRQELDLSYVSSLHFIYKNQRTVDFTFYKKENNFGVSYFPVSESFKRRILKLILLLLQKKHYSTLNLSKPKRLFLILFRIILFPFSFSSIFKDFILKKINEDRRTLKRYKIPLDYIDKTKKITFMETEILIPSKPKDYLVYQYGLNWKKVIKNYNWEKESTEAFK
tara:strand:- start:2701 stop:3405 length:705 start_codon:yes stop_codon:yes gene_type:complete